MKMKTIFDGSVIQYFGTIVTVAQSQKKLHWQNAFAGTARYAIVVHWGTHTTVLDNEDGSALTKIQEGWWSNRPHRDLEIVEDIKTLEELPEEWWPEWNFVRHQAINKQIELYQERNFFDDPEYIQLQNLKASLRKGGVQCR